MRRWIAATDAAVPRHDRQDALERLVDVMLRVQAIGNWLASVDEPPEEAVAVLREAWEGPESLVREYAGCALEQRDR